MTVKTQGDIYLHKTWTKTRLFLALVVFSAAVLSAAVPAKAEGTPTSVVIFTDKSVYNPFAIDLGKTGGTPIYTNDFTADFSIYVYALVLNERGIILKGREGLLTGTLVDKNEYKHTNANQHIGATVNNPGIVGSKTLVFKDDGTIKGDIAGDGIYVALVDMPENIGTKLALPTDELLINITVTDPVAGSAYTDVLIAGFNCMNNPEFTSSYPAHTSSSTAVPPKSDICVVCHRGYEHFFENISGVIDYKYLDAHFKNATARSRVPNPLASAVQQKADYSIKFRWNLSDYNGVATATTWEADAPGSSFCLFCHTYNQTAALLKYEGKRANVSSKPSCNNSNCHTTTKIAGNAVPDWLPAAAAPASELTSISVSSPNYNESLAEKHAHDSTGKDTVPCASCHTTVHGLQIPNSTSTDYTDLALRCLSCHQLFNKHNNNVSCVKCHTNDTHNIRFLQQDLSYNWSRTNVVTCDNCHTNASFGPTLGLNPPQVPYTNHSGDNDAGQKWGDYWTSKNQQAAAGGSTLIKSSTVNISSESVQYGSTSGSPTPLSAAQTVDGSYETLAEGWKSLPPDTVYQYADSNTTTYGVITNWNNLRSASDSGAFATINETFGPQENMVNGQFISDLSSWTITPATSLPIVWVDTGTPQYGSLNGSITAKSITNRTSTAEQTFKVNSTTSLSAVLSFKWRKSIGSVAPINQTMRVQLVNPSNAVTYTWSDTQIGSVVWAAESYDVSANITSTGNWKIRLSIDGGTPNTVGAALYSDFDDVSLTLNNTVHAVYKMDTTLSFQNVQAADNYTFQMNYSTSGDTFDLLVWDGTMWNTKTTLNSATFAKYNYTLTVAEMLDGSPQFRFLDKTQSNTTKGSLNIEYARITPGIYHREIILYHNFTGIPWYASKETAEYILRVKGYVNAGENLDVYAYGYDSGLYELQKLQGFSTTDGWVNVTLPYEAISSSGTATIMFWDSNRTRYDNVADNFYLDYVGIEANSYKFLPCYYCHALLANHKKRALGNIEWVQNGSSDINLKNSTNLSGNWCANCHYNGSTPAGKYKYNGSAWNPVPPLITYNNINPSNPNYGSWYDHSSIVATNFTDAKCKECHGTAAIQTTKQFPHSVEIGSSGGANCTNCHNVGGSAGTGRLVNFTAMNDTNDIHKNLNTGASTSLPASNKKCWACHGNGSEPGSSHPTNYKTPYKCVDCHVPSAGQNLNFTPQSIFNVTQHYWNGSNITTASATSCYACHNKSEMMVGMNLDPDGAAGVYGGANGGSNSTSHYGLKRSNLGGFTQDTAGYCSYCHNTSINNATFYVSDFNNTIYNHSARGTTPLCSNCHNTGRIHNSTLAKPVSNDTYCSTCHGTGGSVATKDKLRHKALNCTECHANNSVGTLAGKDIHAIKYLTQSNTFATTNTSAVNCVTCHQTTTIDSSIGSFSAFKIKTPMRHSENLSNGSVWDSYWTNTTPQTACIYCHNTTLHNTTPLGRILQWNQNYQMYGAIATNTSCGDCHYKGDSNYTQMNSTFISSGLKTPPEITNGTNWKGNYSNYYNHSLDTYYDQDCKNCHGSLLSGSANMSEFLHNAAIGVAGGANCTACHNTGGTAGSGKLVNFSAINDTNAIHKNLNSGASTSLPAENKKCWACHGSGSEPGSGHPSNYKTPYNCVNCHVQGAGQNLNYTPGNTILNVTQHYWNGSNITTANATSCYVCHNKTEMMVGLALDPDGAGTGVYSGANGGNNSVSHYGKKRTDMAVMANATYCNYCHNNATSVFPFINATNNRTISNHSLTYPATNPECKECHSYGRLHNGTIYRPAFALPNSTYCLNCHGSGGSATIKNFEKHNSTSATALNCTQCHLNSSKSIHPVRYLQQDSAWDTAKTNTVNCTTCHQGAGMSGFASAPKVPAPMNHSTNRYNGSLWNSTPGYWTNTTPQSTCDYCHGKIALHNTSGLGNMTKAQGTNTVRQNLSTSRWCANCHYSGASGYAGTLFYPEPPEITNATGKVPAKASDNTNFYNHSQDMATGYNDSKCKTCHDNALDAGATSLNFSHNVAQGGGGANCTSCHYIGGGVQNINITAINDASSIHKDLNKGATASDNGFNDSKKCWACHGTGQEPSGHPTRYKTPYNCTDCHVAGSQNLNYTPNNTVLNVTQHYWNGASIKTPAVTSCYVCHNTTGMIIAANDPDGASSSVYGGGNGGNLSVSHYGKKRNDMAAQQNTTPYCDNCHNGSSAFPFIDDANRTIANHSQNYPATNPVCKDCHSGGRIHNSTLYKPSNPVGNKTYCLSCHGNNGAGGTNYSGAVTSYKEPHNNSKCTECHLNASQSIHPVRYLQQDNTWATTKTSAVNCTNCHQGAGMSGFSSAPTIPVLTHSTNTYSGALWNTTPGYWTNTSQQSSCNYCHGTAALHNTSGLGNITKVKGTNTVRQGFTGGYWCANCHYSGAANYSGTKFTPQPPEVLNISGLVPAFASEGTQFYNHSGDLATSWDDAKCKTCHNNNLGGSATSLNFTHSLGTGGGGANCTSCHGLGGTLSDGKKINQTAMNTSLSIHKDLNKDASASDANYSESKKCWACHGDGTEPSGHPSRYKTPYNCADCHVPGAGQNLNFTPQSIFNVTQHYWNGSNITTASATSCYACHNKSEMMVGLALDPDGASTNIYGGVNGGNNSVSHYGKKRTDMAVMSNTTYCNYCHNNQSSVFPFINATINKTIANHSSNYAATNPVCADCHSSGRIHNGTLYKPAFALPNSSYCLTCHGTGGSATIKNLERHNGSTGLNCTNCHLNSTYSIHPVRYLRQNNTWGTTNNSAVNCTTCHQGSGMSGFASAPLVQTPIWHSNSSYSGNRWNGSQKAFWDNTSQQSSCAYCHGKIALHNDSGLGNSTKIQNGNQKNQSLAGGYWCANCHYNGSTPSGKYKYLGNLFDPVPPEILNKTGLVPANASNGMPFQNHTDNVGVSYDDSRCAVCHISDATKSAAFLHKLNESKPEAGGKDCLNCHATTANDPNGPPLNKRINATAFTNYSVHKKLNNNTLPTAPMSYNNASVACWACHGDGTQPAKHPANYLNPKPCAYCHVNETSNPTGAFNAPVVGRHYPGSVFSGTKIHSTNYTAGSCQVCHNNTYVFRDDVNETLNATVSHYAGNSTYGFPQPLQQTDLSTSCSDCHFSNTTKYGIPKQVSDPVKHSMNSACQGPCHNPYYYNGTSINPIILHNASVGIYYDCYKGGCHAARARGGSR